MIYKFKKLKEEKGKRERKKVQFRRGNTKKKADLKNIFYMAGQRENFKMLVLRTKARNNKNYSSFV